MSSAWIDRQGREVPDKTLLAMRRGQRLYDDPDTRRYATAMDWRGFAKQLRKLAAAYRRAGLPKAAESTEDNAQDILDILDPGRTSEGYHVTLTRSASDTFTYLVRAAGEEAAKRRAIEAANDRAWGDDVKFTVEQIRRAT